MTVHHPPVVHVPGVHTRCAFTTLSLPNSPVSLQSSYPGTNLDHDEASPLIAPLDEGSINYGIQSPLVYSGELSRDEEDGVGQGTGRYTPIPNTFNDADDLKPKGVWQLPHKDYDVSVIGSHGHV